MSKLFLLDSSILFNGSVTGKGNGLIIVSIVVAVIGIVALISLIPKGVALEDVKKIVEQPIATPAQPVPITPPKVDAPDSTGIAPVIPPGSCIKIGHFDEVWVKTSYTTYENTAKVMPLAIAKFTSDSICEQKFWFETGIIGSTYEPLAMLSDIKLSKQATAYTSACDGNRQYASVGVTLKPKESINIWFYPTFPVNPSNFNNPKTGFYDVVVGAYTGCMINGNPDNNYIIEDYVRNIRYTGGADINYLNTWQSVK